MARLPGGVRFLCSKCKRVIFPGQIPLPPPRVWMWDVRSEHVVSGFPGKQPIEIPVDIVCAKIGHQLRILT
jgi:hypothetical protein